MDKFFVGGHKIAGVNGLQDIMFRLKYNSLMVDFHNFSNDVPQTGVESGIGNEIDITYKYKHSANLKMVTGFSMFLFSDDYKNSSDTSDFKLYTMLIVTL